ncbi:MAG: hypothetical protein M1820_002954 [Bogoriella megaspora]|nr:MAG: hypothetical protein M1820_002954 [Bogoriella megaspora]
MRLLHTTATELKDFSDAEIPQYAILSHRWEDEEVLFKDIESNNWKQKAGASKVVGCCREAAQLGYDWVWIDTCSIDKSSSAELQETINSMFFCLEVAGKIECSFNKSAWFTRGWTLQELIAPKEIVFFDKEWNNIGTKLKLIRELGSLTGIDTDILTGRTEVQTASIAKRMSWAAHRKTTRIEDQAYCLLGIFGVNMPMLYGEREAAFLRLQEEIMKRSDDHSLFAWEPDGNPPAEHVKYRGLLAKSPSEFAKPRYIRPNRRYEESAPYSMTNKGLSIALNLRQLTSTPNEHRTELVAVLDCINEAHGATAVAIRLRQLGGLGPMQYARSPPFAMISVEDDLPLPSGTKSSKSPKSLSIYVKQNFSQPAYFSDPKHFYIRNWITNAYSLELYRVCPLQSYYRWNAKGRLLSIRTESYQDFVHLYFRHKRSFSSSAKMVIRVTLRIDGDSEIRSRIATDPWLPTQHENLSNQAMQHRYTYGAGKLPFGPPLRHEKTRMVNLEGPYQFSHDERDYLLHVYVGSIEDQGVQGSQTFIVDILVKQQTPVSQADVQKR